jgi:Protein of unknown function (DUF3285)
MSDPASIFPVSEPASESVPTPSVAAVDAETPDLPSQTTEPKPSYVKLAMRNMVRKRGLSLFHFALTAIGLLVTLVGLSYLTR